MNNNVKVWLYSVGAAFIGGGAAALTGSGGVMYLDPEHFNLSAGLFKTLELAAALFLIGGLGHVIAFLKDKPLPDWDGAPRRAIDSAANAKGQGV